MDEQAIPADWLDKEITIAEVEATYFRPGVSRLDGRWQELKGRMRPGDQVWTFASPADSWRHLAGRAGIALVRAGVAIEAIITMMN